MTLREFLENATNETIYYIGADEGGGFFFIGEASQALTDIVEIQAKALRNLIKSIKYNQDELRALKERKPGSDREKYWQKQVKKKMLLIKGLKERRKTWTPLFDRTILDVRPRILDNGMTIIVDGFCTGKYWSLGEYDPSKKQSSKMVIHPDGVENLRGAILEKAAEDYKNTVKYKRSHGEEPKKQELTTNSLRRFFKSEYFKDICNLDGADVMQMIERQAIQEEIEEAQKAMEEACDG